jgi:hypothetical protein
MMWNHRVVRTFDETYGEYFELAEVYYDKDNKPYAYGSASIGGESQYSLAQQLEQFKQGIEMFVLNYPEDFIGDVNK